MRQEDLDDLVGRLRRQGTDDGEVEAKSSATSLPKDVWDSVSAFANTSGGILLLGLSEPDGFSPTPTFEIDRVLDQFVDGMGDGNPAGVRLTRPPEYELTRLLIDGRPVLVVEVQENTPGTKPCFVTAKGLIGGAYKRVDDKDVRLSSTELFELQHTLDDHAADRELVNDAVVDDLDDTLVDALLRTKSRSKALRGTTDRNEGLTRLNVTDRAGTPRLAGLLALGRYPQQFFPRFLVDVAVHPSTEKSVAGQPVRFIDRQQCEGPLPEVVDDAVNAVSRNLRTRSTVTGRGRVDELEIPPEVIREAVANAVVHREYHPLFRGQAVVVDVFPDRIVVTSPGGLWGGKTLGTLDDGVSRSRNQTLVQLLQDVPLGSSDSKTVEGQGGGVRLMVNEMEAHGLSRPVFRATPDTVIVELRRANSQISVVSPTGSEPSQLPPPGSAAGELLAALSTQEPRSVTELAASVGKTPNTLRPVLRDLVESGLVIATAPPSSRNRKYLRSTSTPG